MNPQRIPATQVALALREQGINEGRMITSSKTAYLKRYPSHFVVFNAQIFTRHGRILKQVDLDLTTEANRLSLAAKAVEENIHVLYERDPSPFWEPDGTPMTTILRNAVWWTRIHVEDQDEFWPMNSTAYSPERRRLICSVARWHDRPAYSVDLWINEEWYCRNTTGAVIQLCGTPPKYLRRAKEKEDFSNELSDTRGRPVKPVFYQRSGLLEYVWFSHGVAVPAILYDNSIRYLESVQYTAHADRKNIQVRQKGEVIGFIWGCYVDAPEVLASARLRLTRFTRSIVA